MNHWADYVIFTAFLLGSMGIGLFFALTGGRQRTTEEFIMADHKLKVLPTTVSMLVSFQSAIMILGGTAETYTGGVQAWLMSMVYFALSLLAVQMFIVPWLYPLKLTSVYTYFEKRFGTKDVRMFAAFLGILTNLLYMGTAMFAPSVALHTATGFPVFASIPIMAAVCTIYTTLGGMKAVIWTDVFQFFVMITGMLAVAVKGYLAIGGYKPAFDILDTENRLIWVDLDPNPTTRHTLWGFLFGCNSMWIVIYGFSQSAVQRYSAVESLNKARLSMLLNIPCIWLMTTLTYFIGVSVVAHFALEYCDPLLSGRVGAANELLPLFVREQFLGVPGFSGLFLATLYSGALSSVSSSLSGCAANLWEDILKDKLGHLSESRAAIINKICVVTFGMISVGLAFLVATVPGPITQVSMSVGSAVTAPLFGMFFVSGLQTFSWIKSKGVFAGGVCGFAFTFWLVYGSSTIPNRAPPLPPMSVNNCTPALNLTTQEYNPIEGLDQFYSISYVWNYLLGGAVTVILSLIFGGIHYAFDKNPESRLQIPDHMFIQILPHRGGYKKSSTDEKNEKPTKEKISTL